MAKAIVWRIFLLLRARPNELQLNRIYFVSTVHSYLSSLSLSSLAVQTFFVFLNIKRDAYNFYFNICHSVIYMYLFVESYLSVTFGKERKKIYRRICTRFYIQLNQLVGMVFGSKKKENFNGIMRSKSIAAFVVVVYAAKENLPFTRCNTIRWISSLRVHAFRFIHSKKNNSDKETESLGKLNL